MIDDFSFIPEQEAETESKLIEIDQSKKISQQDSSSNNQSAGRDINNVYGNQINISISDKQFSSLVGAKKLDEHMMTSLLWNVPYNRNRFFTGREDLLASLRENYSSDSEKITSQVIIGLGGVGKTQIAVEYAYRFKEIYSILWWIHAEETITITSRYLELGKALGLTNLDNLKQVEIIDTICKELERRHGWLLIFDNVEDPQSLVDLIPKCGGDVLMTSRYDGDWGDFSVPMKVKSFGSIDGQQFVLKRIGKNDDSAGTNELVLELGGLPLALEQSCAYIKSTVTSINQYLILLHEKKSLILQEKGEYLSGNYSFSVATTFNMLLDKVSKESLMAAQILKLCSYLSPESIYLNLIFKAEYKEVKSTTFGYKVMRGLKKVFSNHEMGNISLSSIASDPLRLNKELRLLMRYSLIQKIDNTIRIHRLVQLIIRDNMNKNERKLWATQALQTVNEQFIFSIENPQTWDNARRLFDNARVVLHHAKENGIKTIERIKLLANSGMFLQNIGKYEEAERYYCEALNVGEFLLGPNSAVVGNISNNLGMLYYEMSNLQKAQVCGERSLLISKINNGEEHIETSTAYNNLGMICQSQGDLGKAKKHFTTALDISSKLFGDNLFVAHTLNNLASINQTLALHEQALDCAERALTIIKNIHGVEHPSATATLISLAMIHRDLGDITKAKALIEQAYKIDKEYYGESHPTLISDLCSLGVVLQDMGDVIRAIECYERAIHIQENLKGFNHQAVGRVWNNLGMAYRELGDLLKAKEYIERALLLDEEIFGKDHIEVAAHMNNLGGIYIALGDFGRAKQSLASAVRIAETSLGIDHLHTKIYEKHLEDICKQLNLSNKSY